MRTARLLTIAGALGLALIAALLWWGGGARNEALERPRFGLRAVDRENGRAAPEIGLAQTAFGSSNVEPADGFREGGTRAVEASPSLADRSDPSFEFVRKTLATAVEAHLPDLALSDNELDDLAQATLRLRRAQAALRTIPKTREHADQRALERRRLEEAIVDFTYLVEMSPAEFTRRVEPGVGVDVWNPDAAAVDVSIRPIRKQGGSE